MITLQDLEKCTSEEQRQDFIYKCIMRHKGSDTSQMYRIASKYYEGHNVTIEEFQKILYTVTGKIVPDEISPNHKIKNRMFSMFVTQQVQFLLGNGITWESGKQDESLGEDFEDRLLSIAEESLLGGVAYGFYNLDHIECFNAGEFVPLYDETDGALKAGIRFWQIDQQKPLRCTLYEMDGYTEYSWVNGECEILQDKQKYITKYKGTEADGMKIYAGENYPGFPIVPMYAQKSRESVLVGNREALDAYDLIKSGFANDLDEASQIYWLIQNAGGMDEVDLANFLNQIRRTHAAVVDEDGAKAEPHTIDIPHQAREIILARLEQDLFRDFMAFDPRNVSGGAVTATQIMAGYELLNSKEDYFEKNVTKFIKGVLEIAGIDDDPAYTRSMIVNKQEEIQSILTAATYLPDEYVTRKILTILGDADMADELIKQKEEEMLERMAMMNVGSVGQANGASAGEAGAETEEGV